MTTLAVGAVICLGGYLGRHLARFIIHRVRGLG